MESSFIVDLVKAKRGKEINEAVIYISCSKGGGHGHRPKVDCEEGNVFRDIVLPVECGYKSSNSTRDDVVASLQAEYDRLQDGDVFSTWSFSASGYDSRMKVDFKGEMEILKHKKVIDKSGPCDWYTEDFYLHGRFRAKGPNEYEQICKRILGESGFNYVRRWNILKNFFRREKIRTEPLTTDEIECLLEFEKYKLQKTYVQPVGNRGSIQEKSSDLEADVVNMYFTGPKIAAQKAVIAAGNALCSAHNNTLPANSLTMENQSRLQTRGFRFGIASAIMAAFVAYGISAIPVSCLVLLCIQDDRHFRHRSSTCRTS
eukprot:GEMP01063428.1.p1 GENE.GEMP01063428.1~~GEMP01063428.1.p1  ORF type:complete len:332 (+),score=25.55 GEMP01063428.1:51-998(+)